MKKLDFTGTVPLVRLALRRDRIRIPAWVIGISLLFTLIVAAYAEFSIQEMQEMITMASISQGMRLLVSPISAHMTGDLGSFFLFRTSFLICIFVAIMNTQLIIRHTRNNEETGCSEMISSAVVGRYAGLTAGLIVALITNIFLFISLTAGFIANRLPPAGSAAAALSFAVLGFVYAAIATVCAQISASSKGASAIASALLAITFLINSLGNVLGQANERGMGYSSSRLVWLSPIGWTQQVQAFDQNRIVFLVLGVALSVILAITAIILNNRRDIGRGLLAAARGKARATRWLSSPCGLAWRLQRKSLLGWIIALLLIGFIFGAVNQEYGSAIEEIDVFEQFLLSSEYFIYSMIAIVASFIAVFTMQSLLRMRSEEEATLETVLAAPVKRTAWMLGFIVFSLIGTVLILSVFALGTGIAAQSGSREIADFLKAALFHGCAALTMAGLIITIFGFMPRYARITAWLAILTAIFTGPVFGPLLNLPESLRNISPFTHIALLPDQTKASSIVILLLAGVVLSLSGMSAFNKRSLRL